MNVITKTLVTNASTILTTAGIGAMGASTILAVKATPKAQLKIDELKKTRTEQIVQNAEEDTEALVAECKLTLMDYVKTCWLDYLPAGIAMGVGIACILIAKHIDAAKIVALASAAKYAQDKLEAHQKAIEALPEADRAKVEESLDKIIVEQAGDIPPWADVDTVLNESTGELVPVTDADWGTDMLCLDSLSGQYFRSNPDKIERAVNTFRSSILDNNTAVFGAAFGTVGDFYEYLGLKSTELFDSLGWTQDHPLQVYYTSTLTDKSNRPVLVMKYRNQPRLIDLDAHLQ